MRSLGVKAVISAVRGGLAPARLEPGDFVVCDQFVDRTTGRETRSSTGPIVTHVSSADLYDPELRRIALEVIREHGITVHDGGTVVVIQGPRFSTKAESNWFSDAGWEVINMTQYPEAYLCRELGMAVVNIALITDYDAGVLEGTEAVDRARRPRGLRAERGAHPARSSSTWSGGSPPTSTRSGRGTRSEFTRGDGHVAGPRTSASSRRGSRTDRMSRCPRPLRPLHRPRPSPCHGCVRCGASIPISESMRERCNPLGPQGAARAGSRDGPWARGRGRRPRRRRPLRDERRRAVPLAAASTSRAARLGCGSRSRSPTADRAPAAPTCRVGDPSCGHRARDPFVHEPGHPAGRDGDLRRAGDHLGARRGRSPWTATRHAIASPVRDPLRARRRRAGGADPARALRARGAGRLQVGTGRGHRGRPSLGGARHRRHPGPVSGRRHPGRASLAPTTPSADGPRARLPAPVRRRGAVGAGLLGQDAVAREPVPDGGDDERLREMVDLGDHVPRRLVVHPLHPLVALEQDPPARSAVSRAKATSAANRPAIASVVTCRSRRRAASAPSRGWSPPPRRSPSPPAG